MLRRLLFWIAINLRLRKPQPGEDPIVVLQRLVPMLLGVTIIIGAVQYLGASLPPPPWYRRLWRNLRYLKVRVRRLRLAVVGW